MAGEDIRAQIARAESQIEGCGEYIMKLRERIARLEETKPTVAEVKEEIGTLETEVNRRIGMQERFRGENREAYNEASGEELFLPYGNYYDEVDRILDSIHDEITRLENEIFEQQGFIGQLKAWCNSLRNELAKLFN
ncbi:MAG: DUF5082 domain-containing protein [Blautia sp.]|nr:DUF5082 domain-containing protein [Lachnoclostridium sp.]MCM1212676.1 DUF5082 domain-containing protein [Blautia sp.]